MTPVQQHILSLCVVGIVTTAAFFLAIMSREIYCRIKERRSLKIQNQ